LLSAKLEQRDTGTIDGKGLFAIEPIFAGEMLWEADPDAPLISLSQWHELSSTDHKGYSQVDDDHFVRNNPTEYTWNHGCTPNCVCSGWQMFALRDISVGEELTYDYGLVEISRRWEMVCNCGSPQCRGISSNLDYMLSKVQQWHAGRIPPYAQRAIDKAGVLQKMIHTMRSRIWRIRRKSRYSGR